MMILSSDDGIDDDDDDDDDDEPACRLDRRNPPQDLCSGCTDGARADDECADGMFGVGTLMVCSGWVC